MIKTCFFSEKNKLKDVKDEPTESEESKSGAAKQPADKKVATSPTKAATAGAGKQETSAVKKATPKAATSANKANRPGPASTKRQVLVNLKRTSAAAIKAATKTANEAK